MDKISPNTSNDKNIKNKTNQTFKIFLVILFSLILLIAIILMLVKIVSNPDISRLNDSIIKNTTTQQQYNITEILEQGAKQGYDFCNNITRGDIREECINTYLFNEARKEANFSICEQINDEVFVKMCKYNIIIPLVAKAYAEESQAQNNTKVTPSNIELCEQLEGETRKLCENPQKAIEVNPHLLD